MKHTAGRVRDGCWILTLDLIGVHHYPCYVNRNKARCIKAYGGRHQKSWTGPNPNFGRRPQKYKQGIIRDLSEESWRPGLLVPTSVHSYSFPVRLCPCRVDVSRPRTLRQRQIQDEKIVCFKHDLRKSSTLSPLIITMPHRTLLTSKHKRDWAVALTRHISKPWR